MSDELKAAQFRRRLLSELKAQSRQSVGYLRYIESLQGKKQYTKDKRLNTRKLARPPVQQDVVEHVAAVAETVDAKKYTEPKMTVPKASEEIALKKLEKKRRKAGLTTSEGLAQLLAAKKARESQQIHTIVPS